jgi:hypothetical protein
MNDGNFNRFEKLGEEHSKEDRLERMKAINTERKVTRVAPGEAIGARPFKAPGDLYLGYTARRRKGRTGRKAFGSVKPGKVQSSVRTLVNSAPEGEKD